MLGALLSDDPLSTGRVYAFDLAGSALGSLIVLPLFRVMSVESAIVGALLVLVIGIALTVRSSCGRRPPRSPDLRCVRSSSW